MDEKIVWQNVLGKKKEKFGENVLGKNCLDKIIFLQNNLTGEKNELYLENF